MVKNLPCNAGEIGSIPGRGNKTPHAAEQLSLHTATTEHRAASRDSVHHSEDPVASAKTQHSHQIMLVPNLHILSLKGGNGRARWGQGCCTEETSEQQARLPLEPFYERL